VHVCNAAHATPHTYMIVLFYFVLHRNRLPSRAHATATPSPIAPASSLPKGYTVAAGRYADSRERHKCHQLGWRWVQRYRNQPHLRYCDYSPAVVPDPSLVGTVPPILVTRHLSLGCSAASCLVCYLLLCALVSLFVVLVLSRIQGTNTSGQRDMVTTKRKYAFTASIVNAHWLQADPP